MTEKRFTLSQNGTFHTVRDNVRNKPLGVFEFKDDEFPVYFCFHKIIDLMNSLNDENEQLKKDATTLIYANQDYRHENEHLKSENKRLTDKLNNTALEFLNYDMVTMGKATEISEMCYSDFLKFRKENGNPMELQE